MSPTLRDLPAIPEPADDYTRANLHLAETRHGLSNNDESTNTRRTQPMPIYMENDHA